MTTSGRIQLPGECQKLTGLSLNSGTNHYQGECDQHDWCGQVVLKYKPESESPGGFTKIQIAGPTAPGFLIQ